MKQRKSISVINVILVLSLLLLVGMVLEYFTGFLSYASLNNEIIESKDRGNFDNLQYDKNVKGSQYVIADNEKRLDDFGNPPHYYAWDHMPLTYSFDEGCVGPILDRIRWAFEEIENSTSNIVSFRKVEFGADILFMCYEDQLDLGDGEITLGYAEPYYYGYIIDSATISFGSVSESKRPQSCIYYPYLELHEILHVFGYEHNDDNTHSIMYPLEEGCKQFPEELTKVTVNGNSFVPGYKIDDDIVRDLIQKYG